MNKSLVYLWIGIYSNKDGVEFAVSVLTLLSKLLTGYSMVLRIVTFF